jgi:hypothetical protein
MTLMKSILLGSAAGIVAVAGAQAADLPTKKAAPAEYVKICNVSGMAGFIIPGSDTCLKIGGYITGQIEAGNTSTSYRWAPIGGGAPAGARDGATLNTTPASLNANFGFTTRANISLDARSNTAYGVLRGYVEMQFENGNGFDTTGVGSYINLAYVQWAGITAGKAPSFFSFFGGGEGWANIFSPDQQGFNQPDLLAYTATFGGGFSATLAIQSSGGNSPAFTGANAWGASGGGTNINIDTTNYGGAQFGFAGNPDVVANLRLDQSWGSAQLSGVAHEVHVYANGSTFGPGAITPSQNTWGYGVDAGVKFNLPSFGPGDNIQFQGQYTRNAIWYSGIPDGMWGENGAVNGNGLAMPVGDTYYAGLNAAGAPVWATPTAWGITATAEHHFGPTFSIDPEISYVELNWSNSLGELSSNSTSWIAGMVGHWDPVTNLDFELEVLYQNTHESTPGNWGPVGSASVGTVNGIPSAFHNNTDGFAGRFEVTRNF